MMSLRLALPALLLGLAAGLVNPQVTGSPPPALAPFAEDDPIPRLTVSLHPRQETPRQAAESFLYYLAKGYDPGILGKAGGSLGDPEAYRQAWELMGPTRPAFEQFLANWRGTAAVKVLQLEPMDRPERLFVELERVEWCEDHWATSFYMGELEAVETAEGWRVGRFQVEPEQLVFSNIGGHQGWQHSAEGMAVWYARMAPPQVAEPWKEPWVLESIQYEGRTATAQVRHQRTGRELTVRMARVMEGSWVLLSR